MTRLTDKERNDLPDSCFGLIRLVEVKHPQNGARAQLKERRYPIIDVNHARSAKARATLDYRQGHITAAEKMKIFAMADRMIATSKEKKK